MGNITTFKRINEQTPTVFSGEFRWGKKREREEGEGGQEREPRMTVGRSSKRRAYIASLRMRMSWAACVAIFFVLSVGFADISVQRKNVLFLVSDDMRPELTCFSGADFPSPVHPRIHSPNLDALAAKSLLLKRAYVQQAVCSPSRTSLLTGRRPDTTHVYDLVHYFRNVGGNFTTIPQYFKENGYSSIGMGKIFHVSCLWWNIAVDQIIHIFWLG
jgi:hypothetical protein